jgi:hypothetical protein
MKKPGFSWPTCPQANSSEARYEPYDDCPEGWSPFTPTSDKSRMGQASMCRIAASKIGQPASYGMKIGRDGDGTATFQLGGKSVQVRIVSASGAGHSGQVTTYYEASRPRRAKPYYIEYDDANGARQRSWFNLNKP